VVSLSRARDPCRSRRALQGSTLPGNRCAPGIGHRIRRARASFAPDAHADYAVLTSDVAITLAWGMTAGGAYHEPWATRCPNPSAWTGFFDIRYHGTLLHRDVYVCVDGDRCYLPLPRNVEDLRVPAEYAQVTALLSTLSLGSGDSDFRVYLRRTGLVLADRSWPLR
jgi:hypothetical protein